MKPMQARRYETKPIFIALVMALLLPLSIVQAQSDGSGVFFYQKGRSVASRIVKSDYLSEAQIQAALQGFEDGLRQQPSKYSDEQVQQSVSAYHEQQQIKQERLAQHNLIAGEQYIAKQLSDPDYRELDKGMLYRVDRVGQGEKPLASSQIHIQYVAKHIDGVKFDRSDGAVWQSMQGILPGWRIALLNMPVGSRWTLIIPPHLAYGERGAGERVGPQETLVFEIQLQGVR